MDIPPENQFRWRSRDAWLCILALVVCQFVVMTWIRFGARQSPSFSQWLSTSSGTSFTVVIQGGLWLFLSFWFSRAESLREFVVHAGFSPRLTRFGWFAALLALGVALINSYGASRGWTSSSKAPPVGYDMPGAISWFFAFKSVLIVPLYEEATMRGFLYRAFRGSYGQLLSTVLIISLAAYFHWGSVSRSWFTFICLAALWTLLCEVRERSGSLWDCLLAHSVFNAVAWNLLLPAVLALFLAYPLAGRAEDQREKDG